MVYNCKHDLRYKARLVPGGHLTHPVKDAAYAGVVLLRAMRMAMLAGELNGLQQWSATLVMLTSRVIQERKFV